MNYQALAETATKMQAFVEQIAKSSQLLASADEDVLADVGAKEGKRLKEAIEKSVAELPFFTTLCAMATEPELAQPTAAKWLAQVALDIVQKDSNQLQIMGRAYIGREEERLKRDLDAQPHLRSAIGVL